jgi:hypothetical protein
MIKLSFFIILFYCMVLNAACNKREENKITSNQILSQWTFINSDSLQYDEVTIDNENLNFYTEFYGRTVLSYSIKDDSLHFLNNSFKIDIMDCDQIVLTGNKGKYLMYKIPFDLFHINKNQLNPFYLRRCYYLVHLNKMTFEESVNYLNSIKEIKPGDIPREEILFDEIR